MAYHPTYCRSCGASLPADAEFCESCGAAVPKPPGPKAFRPVVPRAFHSSARASADAWSRVRCNRAYQSYPPARSVDYSKARTGVVRRMADSAGGYRRRDSGCASRICRDDCCEFSVCDRRISSNTGDCCRLHRLGRGSVGTGSPKPGHFSNLHRDISPMLSCLVL